MQKATLFVCFALLGLLLFTGCGTPGTSSNANANSNSPGAVARASGRAPIVIATSPVGDIAIDKAVFAAFSAALDSSTVTAASFKVDGVSGTVTYDSINHIAYFRPDGGWKANTTFTATLTTDIKSDDGTPLAKPITFTFSTRATPDTSSPGVSVVTGSVSACVPTDAFSVIFDEDMDSFTLNTQTFSIGGVSGTVTYDAVNRTATFTPDTPFTANTTFTATLTTDIKDLGGQPLQGKVIFTFSTCAAAAEGGVGGKKVCTGNGVDWHLNAHLNLLLNQHFADAHDSFLMVGLSNGGHASWDAHGLAALDTFLGQPSTEDVLPIGQLNAIFNDLSSWPAGTNISGDLLVEAAALDLNLTLGSFDAADASFGHLVVSGMQNKFDGITIEELRAIINNYISTGELPDGLTPKDMLHLVKNINLVFHGCRASDFGKQHLVVVANIKH